MALRFLLDENLRGPFAKAILRHNLSGGLVLDAVSVGEPIDLPLGSRDPDVLIWAARNDRLLVSEDRTTMRTHLEAHLGGNLHSPGVLLLRPHSSIPEVLSFLVLVAHANEATEWMEPTTSLRN